MTNANAIDVSETSGRAKNLARRQPAAPDSVAAWARKALRDSDFAACDSAYLMHFYRTGEKLPFRTFWKDNAPIVQASPIPEFHPTRWLSRNDGTVI